MSPKMFERLATAQEQHQQAMQNFNYADEHHVSKAIHELNSSIDRLKLMLAFAVAEVNRI